MNKSNFKKWIKATLIRAIATFAEAILGVIGTNIIGINEINWVGALSIGATAFVLTILRALAGLPEVEKEVK